MKIVSIFLYKNDVQRTSYQPFHPTHFHVLDGASYEPQEPRSVCGGAPRTCEFPRCWEVPREEPDEWGALVGLEPHAALAVQTLKAR